MEGPVNTGKCAERFKKTGRYPVPLTKWRHLVTWPRTAAEQGGHGGLIEKVGRKGEGRGERIQ